VGVVEKGGVSGEKAVLRFFKPAGLTLRFPIQDFRLRFCTYEGTVLYKSLAWMSCRGEFGVSYVTLDILEPQIERH
jgi:hypothetical protein